MNNIKYLVMDVDGTLTDGKLYIGDNAEVFKSFNVKDGYGIKNILPKKNIVPIIITARESKIVEYRCKELGVKYLFQNVTCKIDVLNQFISEQNVNNIEKISLKNFAYIGDDDLDLQCIKPIKAGHGITACPADSSKNVKNSVNYCCDKNGGEGAVREFIEFLCDM